MKATKLQAGYVDPQDVPFQCGTCSHFGSPTSCELVEGPVQPAGCCNLWDNDGSSGTSGLMKSYYKSGHPSYRQP